MNMDEVGDAIPETGGTDAAEKADPNAGERCPGLADFVKRKHLKDKDSEEVLFETLNIQNLEVQVC